MPTSTDTAQAAHEKRRGGHAFVQRVHGIRYQVKGPGGRQIQIEDPDGNPIELFEPAR
jgi:hypothetical protein